MIFDVDDLFEGHDRMDLLLALKDANPLFRLTAFAVPAYCPDEYLEGLPDWVEVAAHGWAHGGRDCSNPREAENWTAEQTLDVLLSLHPRFVKLWKSPGWQISDGTYETLAQMGWAVADQHYNDGRRPACLPVHCEGDVVDGHPHEHHHVQNLSTNGLAESWESLYPRVVAAESFAFVSEVVRPWQPTASPSEPGRTQLSPTTPNRAQPKLAGPHQTGPCRA